MKYITSIDFKTLLESQQEICDSESNICCITGNPLIENHVVMECGHKFNYLPLYNDLQFFKYELNNNELSGKLKSNEIRCPYCRTKSNKLIPLCENIEIIPGLNVRPVAGINVYFAEGANIRQITRANMTIWKKEQKKIEQYYKKQYKFQNKI